MVRIIDASLGGYSVTEDFQGLKVEASNGQVMAKVSSLNEALQYIATRMVIESEKTVSLAEYAALRKEIFEKIVAAQGVEQFETTEG